MIKSTIHFLLFCLIIISCKKEQYLKHIEGKNTDVSELISSDETIENFIKPYKARINNSLDSIIAYSPKYLSKKDLEPNSLNTAVGNFMADAVFEMTNLKISEYNTKPIDFVLLNHGGIRSSLPSGNLSKRTAYNLMPFENAIVLIELTPSGIQDLLKYLSVNQRAHPISGLKLAINKKGQIIESSINNKDIDLNKNYVVATSDYLLNGGDKMNFFKLNKNVSSIDYKIRDALIDYFSIKDTIAPISDNRFIYLDHLNEKTLIH